MSVDPEKARGYVIWEKDFNFTEELWELYALSIGFGRDPTNEDHMRFIYEIDDGFTAFPTIAVLSLKVCLFEMFYTPGLPQFDIAKLLHGEQIVESYNPIRPGSTVKWIATLADLADKGKGMLMTVKIDIKDKTDPELLYATCYMKFYVRGLGGFGDKGILDQKIPDPPTKTPDETFECPTEKHQALYYRLWGDINPIHIDQTSAQISGFEGPILHGLCTYGIVARAVYEKYCKGQPEIIKNISSRFVSHVYPGETISVDMFKEGSFIYFSAITKERKLKIATGFVELRPKAKL